MEIQRTATPKPELKPTWEFHVDTNGYAGNFERQLVAYMTGCYAHNCGVGEDESLMVSIPAGFVEPEALHEHAGCWCYADSSRIAPKSKELDSVSCTFYTEPSEEQIKFMVSQAQEYFAKVYGQTRVPTCVLAIRIIQGWRI